MEIRDLVPEDRDGVGRLIREVYRESSLAMWYEKEPTEQELDKLFGIKMAAIGVGGAVDIVAVDEGRIVGECEVVSMGSYGKIGILIEKAQRRGGLGGKMLARAFERCPKLGIGRVVAEVAEANKEAIMFFKKHGFEETGISEDSINRHGRDYKVAYLQREVSG
ncbi:MAG: GNAT family N-acetyltransferase [Candidatus Micrarchaeota archaeon]|nr:GNAT family N-acetyltransferase [Candidatus Micrarchaeota archaeon]